MDEASWLEVSIQVSQEQVEAIAEVLGRFAKEGVVIEQIRGENTPSSTSISHLSVKVFGYLYADETVEERKKKLEECLWHLSQIQPLPAPTYRLIHNQDWMASWKKHYRPLKVGEKLAILPAWAENIFPARIPIRINPGMVFGSGTHPTTQLCLEMMENRVQPGQNIFDIGCGSGILSAAAVKLGGGRVYGVDISAAAIASSTENAEINQVLEKVDFYQGSVTEIMRGCFSILQAPLVIANILAPVILRLFDDGLARLVEPGGFLILSGILAPQISKVSSKAKTFGLELIEQLEIDDWAALGFQK
ncbi:MAG: 50S ribosomal protein L11 methyltransferase [Anaerolineaceae bacterium]|nr:50S ribosomal protein L11 methyltransferase [Anaerolineaceae bacterium]